MDFEICCSASNHITPKKQVGANWDAESVKMFTGHRVIKRSGGLSGCSGLFLRFLHPFCWGLQMGGPCQKSGFDFLGLHLVEKVGRMFFVCLFEHFTVIMENWIWTQYRYIYSFEHWLGSISWRPIPSLWVGWVAWMGRWGDVYEVASRKRERAELFGGLWPHITYIPPNRPKVWKIFWSWNIQRMFDVPLS